MPEEADRTGRGPASTVTDPGPSPGLTGPPPESGLSRQEVAERVATGRTNDVPVRAGRSVGQIIRGNVFTRINAMIAVLFAIIAVIGPVQDGLFALVIVINTFIGIVQELRAKRTLDKLAIVNAARPRVVRDGATIRVATQEIVLDEVLEVGVGDQIVVDGEVTWAGGLEVDESLLTGEADPVLKQPGDTVMSGSFVVAGTGRFRATKVGRHAYAVRLAEEASRFSLVHSELRSGIDLILRWITFALFPIGALLIYSQLFMGGHVTLDAEPVSGGISGPLADALRSMVAALVSMIPEGLILLTSIAFAVGVIRLGRHKCLVQELPAVEGLARVDVVCTDKTGTLTEVGMKLAEIRDLGGGAPEADGSSGSAPTLVLAALADTDPDPNPSMAAIAEGLTAQGRPAPGWTVTALAPFSSARKWSGASLLTPPGRSTGCWARPTFWPRRPPPPRPRPPGWAPRDFGCCCWPGPRCGSTTTSPRAPCGRWLSWSWTSGCARTPGRRWTTSPTRVWTSRSSPVTTPPRWAPWAVNSPCRGPSIRWTRGTFPRTPRRSRARWRPLRRSVG